MARKVTPIVSGSMPKGQDILWLKPVGNGFSAYLRNNGAYQPIKVMDDKGTVTPHDDIPIDPVDSSVAKARTGYYECGSSALDAIKTIAVENFSLEPGGSMKVMMENTNTADNVSLNINGIGAKPLYYAGKPVTAENTWEKGETLEIYYDGSIFHANSVDGHDTFTTGEKVRDLGIEDIETAREMWNN